MKAIVAAFNQEKALVGAFSVITNLRMQLFEALISTDQLDVVAEGAGVVHPVALAPHHLQKMVEWRLVIVEDKHILSGIDKLLVTYKDFMQTRNIQCQDNSGWLMFCCLVQKEKKSEKGDLNHNREIS